ncbi:MAG: ribonuclease [Eubacterium sp.]|nr:ribonuclease [Eubacterium sp.]
MNSKWIYRRILGILLVGLLVLGISACGKKGKEATTTALNVVTTEATTAATTEATEETTEATESTTEATEAATEATTEATTEAKTEEVTEEKTEEPTEEETEAPTEEETTAASDEELLDKDGTYTSKEDVALYIHQYGELPSNFITKKEAKKLGWSGGSLEKYAPGKSIGGDTFGNREGILPDYGTYHECDIDTKGKKERGAKRIVYSDDGRVYYTGDHYESFELLYGEER